MKLRLLFASLMTIGMLISFIFFVLLMGAYFLNAINLPMLILLTAVINILIWLISPAITDWMQKTFYRARAVTYEEFEREHPAIAKFLSEVCAKHKISKPRLRIIGDNNPTAFCYGSFPANARLALSEGIFKYLNEDEQKAVVGHELGHIVNRDFIVMTFAILLVQVLYQIYSALIRSQRHSSRNSKGKGVVLLVAIVAYVLYIVGQYLLLYLTRTREYMADQFSAQETRCPDCLSMALVKIGYGIVQEVDDQASQELLQSTRSLGIFDFRAAPAFGSAFAAVLEQKDDAKKTPVELLKLFLFDLFSPWAKLIEINSTHPLIGNRVRALSNFAKENGIASQFDADQIKKMGAELDKGKLYQSFAFGAFLYFLPFIAALLTIISIYEPAHFYGTAGVAIVGGLYLILGLYQFIKPLSGHPEKTTTLELMQDPYANPLRGRYVELDGKIIGKAEAGSLFGEDVKMHDRGNGLIYLNYESWLPVLGNLIFALTRGKNLIGKDVKAIGWFRRTSGPLLDLSKLEMEGGTINSYVRMREFLAGLFWIVIAFLLFKYRV